MLDKAGRALDFQPTSQPRGCQRGPVWRWEDRFSFSASVQPARSSSPRRSRSKSARRRRPS